MSCDFRFRSMYTSRTGSDLLPTLIIAFQSLSQLPQVCHVFFSNLIQCFSFKDFFQSFVKFNSRFKSQTRAVVLPIPPLLSRFSPSVGLYTCQKSTCSEIVFKKISFCRKFFSSKGASDTESLNVCGPNVRFRKSL